MRKVKCFGVKIPRLNRGLAANDSAILVIDRQCFLSTCGFQINEKWPREKHTKTHPNAVVPDHEDAFHFARRLNEACLQ